MSEHVLRSGLEQAGLAELAEAASSGLRVREPGEPANPRAVRVLGRRGYACQRHSARQFELAMFRHSDLLIALDSGHEQLLRRAAPDGFPAARVRLLRSFDPAAAGDLDVPDPIGGDIADYEQALLAIEAAMPGVMAAIRREAGPPPAT